MTRKIARVLKSRPTVEGAGVHLKRSFGFREAPELDPFLLLDDFHSDNPEDYLDGFPWHPHRGIETITYVLHGNVEHGDSMGNSGIIGEGDVQWMTAGSGIIHQEMPRGDAGGLLWGFQLWANLPASHKMMEPRYQEIQAETIPVITAGGGITVRVVCGEFGDVRGPVEGIVIEPQYLDVTVRPDTSFVHDFPDGHTVLAYVIEGAGRFDTEPDPYAHEVQAENYFSMERDCVIGRESLIQYESAGGVEITAVDSVLRFLLVSGRPIGEPVSWYGPIVMNTQDELKTAFEEYREGTFLKHEDKKK